MQALYLDNYPTTNFTFIICRYYQYDKCFSFQDPTIADALCRNDDDCVKDTPVISGNGKKIVCLGYFDGEGI